MAFSDIPNRSYTKVSPDWWNALKQAGAALEAWFGVGYVAATTVNIANNQSSALAVLTALDFTTIRSAWLQCFVKRSTNSTEINSVVDIYVAYRNSGASWVILDQVDHGDNSGLTFSIDSSGQLKYTSTNMSGSGYSGSGNFRSAPFA